MPEEVFSINKAVSKKKKKKKKNYSHIGKVENSPAVHSPTENMHCQFVSSFFLVYINFIGDSKLEDRCVRHVFLKIRLRFPSGLIYGEGCTFAIRK